jgi:hypothetical protein
LPVPHRLPTHALPGSASPGTLYAALTPYDPEISMTEKVTGPASYFPAIEKRYGRPIDEWLNLIRSSPLSKHKQLVDWLKAEHGVGHGHATALVGYALAQNAAAPNSPH